MKTELTDVQINEYRANGFMKIEGFLSRPELNELKAAVIKATLPTEKPSEDDSYGKSIERVFIQQMNLHRRSPEVKRVFLHPELGQMLAQLEGVDGYRVWHDQTLQKMPWANATALHLDNPYWSFHSKNAISIWVALDRATLKNGCLFYLPGTHKMARYDNVELGPDMSAIFDQYPEWEEIEPVALAAEPGDALIHNGLLAHGAATNMTPNWRRAMTCAYMPIGSTFNGTQNVLPQEYFDSLKVGDVLNNEETNPIVWQKS